MTIIAGLAPVFAVLEVAQLYVAHRYIGPAQIRRQLHPLDAPQTPPWWLSVGWMFGLWADYLYQVALFFEPPIIKLVALLLIAISLAGFSVRRVCGLRWGLVLLTFEGALRVGCFLAVFEILFFHPHWENMIFRFFS